MRTVRLPLILIVLAMAACPPIKTPKDGGEPDMLSPVPDLSGGEPFIAWAPARALVGQKTLTLRGDNLKPGLRVRFNKGAAQQEVTALVPREGKGEFNAPLGELSTKDPEFGKGGEMEVRLIGADGKQSEARKVTLVRPAFSDGAELKNLSPRVNWLGLSHARLDRQMDGYPLVLRQESAVNTYSYPIPAQPRSLAIANLDLVVLADINADDRIDLLVSPKTMVNKALGKAGGGFELSLDPILMPTGNIVLLVAGGTPPLLVAATDQKKVHICTRLAEMTPSCTPRDVPAVTTAATVGDLDMDGQPDVAAISGGQLALFLGKDSHMSCSGCGAPMDTDWRSVAIADLDGGAPELILLKQRSIAVYSFKEGKLGSPRAVDLDQDLASGASIGNAVLVGDLDGDGKPDLLLPDTGLSAWLLLNLADADSTRPLFTGPARLLAAASGMPIVLESNPLLALDAAGARPNLVSSGVGAARVSILNNQVGP